jgi:hypothetical protein
MTDIWRSFVAQRCLWELTYGLVFHAPEVEQDRNQHNLFKDFEDEVPGYLNNRRIVSTLDGLALRGGETEICNNLRRCYEAMVGISVIPDKELVLLEAWLTDLAQCQATPRSASPATVNLDAVRV